MCELDFEQGPRPFPQQGFPCVATHVNQGTNRADGAGKFKVYYTKERITPTTLAEKPFCFS